MNAILVIGIPVLAMLAVGFVGSTRRIGFWPALIIAIVATPIVGFLIAALSGHRPWPGEKRHRRKYA